MRHSCIVCQRSLRQNNQVQSIFSQLFTSEVRNANPFFIRPRSGQWVVLPCLKLTQSLFSRLEWYDPGGWRWLLCACMLWIIVVDVAVVIITVRWSTGCPKQGCIFHLTCSHHELTKDHVLTNTYVKFFRTVMRNAVNKSVWRKKVCSWLPLNKHAMNI